jgi:hypothetical protein
VNSVISAVRQFLTLPVFRLPATVPPKPTAAEKQREQWRLQKARRRARRPTGVCYRCAVRPARAGKSDCEQCLAYDVAAKKNERDRRIAGALCVKCGKVASRKGRLMCAGCCDRSNAEAKARGRRNWLKGKCRCGREVSVGKSCEGCIKRGRNKSAEAKKRSRYGMGFCAGCPANRLPDGKLCQSCQIKRENRRKAVCSAADKRRRDRRKAQGLCVSCRAPAKPGRLQCERHLAEAIKRTRRAWERTHGPPRERLPRTHCGRGHLLDDRNTYHYRGRRNCRICGNAAVERYRVRKLARTRRAHTDAAAA